jgi:hypothetical protein
MPCHQCSWIDVQNNGLKRRLDLPVDDDMYDVYRKMLYNVQLTRFLSAVIFFCVNEKRGISNDGCLWRPGHQASHRTLPY